MPIGIVSEEDFEKEIDNTPAQILPMKRPGRSDGDNNVPDSLRKIIGETSEIDGRQEALEIARSFGISDSSVSAYANGSVSTATMDKTPNRSHINAAKERISKRARGVLRRSLVNITDEKLEHLPATDLASIAKQMSGIVKDMEPEHVEETQETKPRFIVMAPQMHKEEHYTVVVQARN